MAGRGPKISLAFKLVKGFFGPFGIFGHKEGQICSHLFVGRCTKPRLSYLSSSLCANLLIAGNGASYVPG